MDSVVHLPASQIPAADAAKDPYRHRASSPPIRGAHGSGNELRRRPRRDQRRGVGVSQVVEPESKPDSLACSAGQGSSPSEELCRPSPGYQRLDSCGN